MTDFSFFCSHTQAQRLFKYHLHISLSARKIYFRGQRWFDFAASPHCWFAGQAKRWKRAEVLTRPAPTHLRWPSPFWPQINFEGFDEGRGWKTKPAFPPLQIPSSSIPLVPSVGAGMETNLQIVLCLRAHGVFFSFKSNWPRISFMTTLNQMALLMWQK